MSEQTPPAAVAAIKSRPIGRILRFILGAFMLTLIVPQIAAATLLTDASSSAMLHSKWLLADCRWPAVLAFCYGCRISYGHHPAQDQQF